MYDNEVAEIWDPVYRGRGRDYAVEAQDVEQLIRQRCPDAASLLDVACGTGEHLRSFGDLFAHVEGVELSEGMLAVGRARTPELALHQGDMRTFDLGRRFDAITCMFSSIGHLRTIGEVDATLVRFVAHLNPGGVVVVEPWWFPETFVDGYVTGDVVPFEGRTIARVSHSSREGDATRMRAHFVVADAEAGLRHFTEDFLVSLFAREQYEAAFLRAGCTVEYVEGGPAGRGLFVGVYK
ncbi:class I SAM-dependent methyltransferase [Actinokineospora sp.]|uniref:class I SAM-dependent methyltransferase n=1 Tax=Actinokineospora sp. TaxID=1872133 RepID=UPI004037EA43